MSKLQKEFEKQVDEILKDTLFKMVRYEVPEKNSSGQILMYLENKEFPGEEFSIGGWEIDKYKDVIGHEYLICTLEDFLKS